MMILLEREQKVRCENNDVMMVSREATDRLDRIQFMMGGFRRA